MSDAIKHQQAKQQYGVALLFLIAVSTLAVSKYATAADVIDFALGENSICIVDATGKLDCRSNSSLNIIPPDTGNSYTKVSSGGQHSCAITQDGDIECWGNANFGALNAPVSSSPFVAISSSEGHSCALDANGQVACWGLNTNGQTDVPSDNADFVAIYTGTVGSCGTKSSGQTVCWSNTYTYNIIDGQEGIIDMHLPQRSEGDDACVVYEQGTILCYLSFGLSDELDDGPYTKVGSNGVMRCGLKVNGDMDCNLSVQNSAQTTLNTELLAEIESLPALIDFDTRYEYDYHMSFCGVGVDQQLYCLGDSLPVNNLPGEDANLPIPTDLSLSIYGENVAELLWNFDLFDIQGVQGQFRVYRNGEMISQSFANASYLDRDFELGVPYVYQVSYITPGGLEGGLSEPLEVNGEFTDPDNDEVITGPDDAITLSGVVVNRYGEDSLELFWDRPVGSTRQYDVYRNGELIASVPGPSYFDNQINTTNAYQYTIVAISSDGSIQATGFAQVASSSGLQCF